MTIDDFLNYLRYERNYSERTVQSYGEDLRAFESYFKNSMDHALSWESVDSDVIRDWMEHMMDKGNNANGPRVEREHVGILHQRTAALEERLANLLAHLLLRRFGGLCLVVELEEPLELRCAFLLTSTVVSIVIEEQTAQPVFIGLHLLKDLALLL